jgi:ABC-type transport system involved in multi-copper enzyme maturation permease subunit
MTFLPIAQRELAAAARRRGTFRFRWWTTVIGVVVTLLNAVMVEGARRRGSPGAQLFSLLTSYAFGLSAFAGVFLTADSISEEKREGTLGLLFLTDLRGYDVVLGKFFARSLTAFYALLALLPATALPLLLGGVTGSEFARMAMALLNMLLFSLAAGICVSVFRRDSRRALGDTFGLQLLLLAAIPLLHGLAAEFGVPSAWLRWTWLSPTYSFVYARETAYALHAPGFWWSLAGSHALAWCFLALASWRLPVNWQDKPTPIRREFVADPNGRNLPQRSRARARLLERNPVLWLVGSQLRTQWGAWFIVCAWALTLTVVMLVGSQDASELLVGYVVLPFGFCLKALFGLQACRFFAEGRRNGALEFLLCTPLTNRELIRGQALALARAFFWPVLLFLALLMVPAAHGMASTPWSFNLRFLVGPRSETVLPLLYSARMMADLFALCWVGMALALTMKKPQLAAAATLIFVLVLPSIFCWADFLVDLLLIAWSTNRLQRELRSQPTAPFEFGPSQVRLTAG